MGCTGSKKAAQAPKTEEKAASTLLQEPGAVKSEEPKAEAPATQVTATEPADTEAAGTKAPADTAKAEETVETQEAPAPNATTDATLAKAEEVQAAKSEELSAKEPGQGASEEASAAAEATPASTDEKIAAPDASPIVADGDVVEKLPEDAVVAKTEVAEVAVSLAAADATAAAKQGGCLGFCAATEAQSEITVQK